MEKNTDFISSPVYVVPQGQRVIDGWMSGPAPGFTAETWPRSTEYGIPLRHLLTVKVPQAFIEQDSEFIGLTLFGLSQWDAEEHIGSCVNQPKTDNRSANPNLKFSEDEIAGIYEFAIYWHTQDSYDSPLCEAPNCCESADPKHVTWIKQGVTPLRGHVDENRRIPVGLVREKGTKAFSEKRGAYFMFGGFPDHLVQVDHEDFEDFDLDTRPSLSFSGERIGLWHFHLLHLDTMEHYYDT